MGLILGFAVTVCCVPLAASVAKRLGILDCPGPLKPQAVAVPYLGGAAVLAGIGAGMATRDLTLLIPLLLAFALGLADDIADLPVAARLACEIVVCGVAVAVLPIGGPASALLAVAVVGLLLNAVNLLDGLDGLAVGSSLVSAVCFAVLLRGAPGDLALAAAGAFAGFAVWNRPPARIYLGDSGSYLVGTTLALLLVTAAIEGPAPRVSAGALFVALPVADTVIAILRRWRAHRPLLVGDRGHVYDQLVDRGWRPAAVAVGCISAQVLLGAAGLIISTLGAAVALAASLTLVTVTGIAAVWAFARPR